MSYAEPGCSSDSACKSRGLREHMNDNYTESKEERSGWGLTSLYM